MKNTNRQPRQEGIENKLAAPSPHNKVSSAPAVFPTFSWVTAAAILGVLTVAMFADIIFFDGGRVLSSPHTDIASQFLSWRDFGFGELRKGNLALWNPHLFSGAPFFGGFQSALLYPLNFPYLILPLNAAINTGIILHVFLMGLFMFLWVRQRRLHPLAALLSGIIAMFCGAHFLHIYAGHLPNLCAMIWVPLILLAVDGLLEKPSLGWVLMGSFAFAMQILAGHPQYVYYTGMTILVYAPLSIFAGSPRLNVQADGGISHHGNQDGFSGRNGGMGRSFFPRIAAGGRPLIAIAAMIAAGAALSAVQILPGLEAARESVRTGGVPFSFAAMFSFPPENFLTLLVPYFFGDLVNAPYWGRAYLWEMNLFIGINGFILAIYGLVKGGRPARALGISAIFLLVLALGAHTPLFRILYECFPGFDSFRGTSKFIFFASLCLVFLCAIGFDALLKKNHPTDDLEGKAHPAGKRSLWKMLISGEKFYLFMLIAALLAAGGALYLKLAADGILSSTPWREFLQWIASTRESYLNAGLYTHELFVDNTAVLASSQLFVTVLILLISAWLWRVSGKRGRTAAYGIFIVAILEVLIFARLSVISFVPEVIGHPPLAQYFSSIKGDARILNLWAPNSALAYRTFDIWGYDPGIPRRYAELIAFTQGINPRQASQYINFRHYHPLLKMLRLRYVILPGRGNLEIREFPAAMNRLHLITNWQTASSANEIFMAMGKPEFDPEKTVILEKTPSISGNSCPTPGSARILSSSTDELTIAAKLTCPAILLITDNYAQGWQVEPIDKGSPNNYEITRANYTLMAIPLTKGNHIFKATYKPGSFRVGFFVSFASCVSFIALFGFWVRQRRYE